MCVCVRGGEGREGVEGRCRGRVGWRLFFFVSICFFVCSFDFMVRVASLLVLVCLAIV